MDRTTGRSSLVVRTAASLTRLLPRSVYRICLNRTEAKCIQTLPVVTSDGTWRVDMNAVTVNGKVVAEKTQALLDTGKLEL